jgi:hypothetical protein
MTCHRNIRWTWIESVWFINLNLASFQALFLNLTVHKKSYAVALHYVLFARADLIILYFNLNLAIF